MRTNRVLGAVLCCFLSAALGFGQIEGRGLFVAAGNPAAMGGDGEGMIGTSADGVTWELIELDDIDESLEKAPLSGVAFGQGRLVAVGGSTIVVSEDVENWRLCDSMPDRLNGGLNTVAYGNGLFLAMGGGSAAVWSRDGLHWSKLQDAGGNATTLSPELDFGKTHVYGLVFHDGKFYALANGNIICVLAPGEDGLTVESSAMKGNVTSRLNDMAVGNGRAVIVGTVEDYISTDMVKWKKIEPWQQYFGVCFAAGKFVGVTGYGAIYYSADGDKGTWKEASSGKLRGNQYWSVAYGNGVFVAGAKGQTSVSQDGVTWTPVQAPMRFKKIIFVP